MSVPTSGALLMLAGAPLWNYQVNVGAASGLSGS